MTTTVQKLENKTVLGYQGIIRDIMDCKRIDQTLQHVKEMEALSNLAGGMAHEIRNPLAISSSSASCCWMTIHVKHSKGIR